MEITLAQNKAFNALVYFAEKLKPLDLTKAIKLLYLADEFAIEDSGVPITWLNYKAWKFGPVPEEIWNKVKAASNLEVEAIDQIRVTSAPSPEGIILDAKKEFDDSQFSDYEIDILNDVIKKYGRYSAEQLVETLHKEGDLLDTDLKRSAFEVAYQSYLMQENLI